MVWTTEIHVFRSVKTKDHLVMGKCWTSLSFMIFYYFIFFPYSQLCSNLKNEQFSSLGKNEFAGYWWVKGTARASVAIPQSCIHSSYCYSTHYYFDILYPQWIWLTISQWPFLQGICQNNGGQCFIVSYI